jgi:hypothetical protein
MGAAATGPLASTEARVLLLKGKAPEGLRVHGHLCLAGEARLTRLPAGLQAQSLDLTGCPKLTHLPPGLSVRALKLTGCARLRRLPEGLECDQLEAQGTALRALPADLHVRHSLDLSNSLQLKSLPARLLTNRLILQGCTSLTRLPRELRAAVLDLRGCTGLVRWPRGARLRVARLDVGGCPRLRSLPDTLSDLLELNVAGCRGLRALPQRLTVKATLDVADTGLTGLPESLRGARLSWRGVAIDEDIAFHPERITAEQVLGEWNAERRRVLLERMGHQRFLVEANAEVLDTDEDAGGQRRLLRVRLAGDEDLVCVAVRCPSTGHQYLLRVPPTMTTCAQAVAWTAGFEEVGQYRPLVET